MATAKRKQEEAEGLCETSDQEDQDCADLIQEHHVGKRAKYHDDDHHW